MVELTSLNPIFFPAWFLLNFALCYHGEAQRFFYWWVQSIFLNFHVHVAPVESISLHWVSDWFKNSKWTIPQWSHHERCIIFSSMKLCFWNQLWKFILVNPLLFVLIIIIKDLFFITCNDILEKLVISLPRKNTMDIFTFLSFSSGSKSWIRMYWDQVLILEYVCMHCILPILLKHLDRVLMSIHFWTMYHQNKNFENRFQTWWLIMTPWS